MARLPIVGADDETWGDLLNSYESLEHNADGTHKAITLEGGVTLHSGTGVPAAGLGVDNDFYFRKGGTAGSRLYHKEAGAWLAFTEAASVSVLDEGLIQGAISTINFVGAGVSASVASGVATVTVPAAILTVQEEGASQGTATTLNFAGSGIVAAVSGGVATITSSPVVRFKETFGRPLLRGAIPNAALLTKDAIAGRLNWPASISALPEATTSLATQLSGIAAGTQKRILPAIYREAFPSITAANVRLYGQYDVAVTGMDRWDIGPNFWSAAAAPNAATSFVSSLTVPAFTIDGDSPPITDATLAAGEQVMLDGVMYDKRAAGSTLAVGEWMLDGSRHVVVRPANGVITGHRIEVTTRTNWLTPGIGGTGMTVEGIYFYGAPSGADTAAPIQQNNQANLTIRECMLGFTHGICVAGGGAVGLKIADNVFHNCGTVGVVSSSSGTQIAGNIAFNCGGTQNHYAQIAAPNNLAKLDSSGYTAAWGSGFVKLVCDYGTIINNVAWNNGFAPYWQDVLCRFGGVVNNVTWDNRDANVQVEVSSYFKVYGNHIFQTDATQFTSASLGIYISSSRDGDVGPDIYAGQEPNVVMRLGTAYKLGWQTSRTDLPPTGTNNAGSGGFKRVRLHDNIAILRKTGGQGAGGPDIAVHWSDITTGAPGAAINDASNTGWHVMVGFENATDVVTGMTWPDDFIFLSDLTGLTGQQAGGWFYNISQWRTGKWDTGTNDYGQTLQSRYLTYAEQATYLNMYGLPMAS